MTRSVHNFRTCKYNAAAQWRLQTNFVAKHARFKKIQFVHFVKTKVGAVRAVAFPVDLLLLCFQCGSLLLQWPRDCHRCNLT